MKAITNFTLSAMLGMALLAGTAQAQDARMRLIAKNQTAHLIYQTLKAEVVEVEISDEDGKVLMSSRFAVEGSFMRPYSLAELPPGIYYFALKDSKGVHTRKFSTLAEEEQKGTIELHKTGTANELELVVKRHNSDALTVTLYNQLGELLHEESIIDQLSFRKVFTLQKLQGQEVLVRVSGKSGSLYAERFQF